MRSEQDLEAVAPVEPVPVRHADDFGVLELAEALLAQGRLPLGDDVTQLPHPQTFNSVSHGNRVGH